MSDTKGLLERWATLEPSLCKRETRPNKDWHEEFEDYYIAIQTDDSEGWQLVYSDREARGYFPNKNEALARIQWAVQQAIIEKGWPFASGATYDNPSIFWARVRFTSNKGLSSSLAEALLTAYLEALSD